MASKEPNSLLHGTLDALVLKTLAAGPHHGYGIARALESATGGQLDIEEGSLYPALYRMEKRGWIDAEWGTSDLQRRVKLYRLTAKGRRQLDEEVADWQRLSEAIRLILQTG